MAAQRGVYTVSFSEQTIANASGDYDLLMKLYVPADADVGKYINDHLLDIDGIERSLTTQIKYAGYATHQRLAPSPPASSKLS